MNMQPSLHCVRHCVKFTNSSNRSHLLWQFVPVQDYSNAERLSMATSFTPLLVNLKSMTSKLNVDVGCKNSTDWKVEKAVHYFVHADMVTTDSSAD